MKKFSKIISLFLVLALCISTFIVSASATTKAKNYTLNLNANKSKGYSWTCTVNNKKAVSFTVKKKNVSKTTCKYTFTFTGKQKGSAVATLKYGTKKKIISQKTLNLTVDENKNVTKIIPPKNYVLKLNTTSTTNYNYSYHSSDKSVAKISADLKFNNKGATYIFTFKGLKKGKVTYTIKYQSSNKKSSTKVVKLNVDNKLNVTLAK